MMRGSKIVVAASVLMLLTGCSSIGERLECIAKGKAPTEQASKPAKAKFPLKDLSIEIGVDGSESMVGFVSQVGSRYSDAIRALEGVIASQGLSDRTQYWRLGIGKKRNYPQSLTSAQFKSATRPEFYCRGSNPAFDCVSSSLRQLYEDKINSSKPKTNGKENLKVLLTDLEPDSGAIDVLVGAYQKVLAQPGVVTDADPGSASSSDTSTKANKPNNKVSILAVRSQFNGTIFPAEQGTFQPFTYNTEGKELTEAGRPFYLILSGPEAAVNEFSQQIRKQQTNVAQSFQEVSYSSGQGETIGIDLTKTKEEENNWKALRPINAFQRKVPANPSEWLLVAIKQRKASNANNPIPVRLYTQTSPELIGAKLPASAVEVIDESAGGFAIKQVSERYGQLSIDAVLEPGNFPKGIQSIQPTLKVTRDSLNKALWVDWNSDTGKPAGSKTQNLLLFLSGLKQAVSSEQATSPIIKICLGVNSSSSSNPSLILFIGFVFVLVVGGGIIMLVTLNRNKKDAY